MAERIALENFLQSFGTAIELSSVALGGRVTSLSDEFFAEAFHLLLVEPAPSLKGQFGPKGALYSGWETRRHNPNYDWCVVKLGTTGTIFGFDVDTTHFNGNEAPEVSIQALHSVDGRDPVENDSRWIEILPKVSLGPSSRHLFKIPETQPYNYVKLNMYPDGGIARFRVYGSVSPVFPADESASCDLAHVFAGGKVVFTSDQHFGVGSNLIIPGRGKDMGDGWETKRSRQKGHKDWVIIQLGAPCYLEQAEIDTAHFKGNFPESCELHATISSDTVPAVPEDEWISILPRSKLGPHRQHYFQLENVADRAFTHVRLTIHPDGGVKRVRIIGKRAAGKQGLETSVESTAAVADAAGGEADSTGATTTSSKRGPVIPALPLTFEAFAPFGKVVQAWDDPHAAPRGIKLTPANQGTATKFHKLSLLEQSYPANAGATSGLSVYRCAPIDAQQGGEWPVRVLERHPYTNQAFVPMGSAASSSGYGAEDALKVPGSAYLVIVAKNGSDDKPDLTTMRAFIANAGQGIVYDTGIWR
ncbi:Allantoicase [Punctularia strigosozonata HHB-11173 SS5]|uniref:Allantoicase n=1 Tax=Punctularia strigosozonata (strain HHB-11173) TaxID=741275 RepID=UPI0004417AC9|nr:Allantoicase [Punctularia strigosozonata HHB-11173 SS5]EIN11886.1 Allantoicase [Punctularia strigosozonata HHB-11173 SS5]